MKRWCFGGDGDCVGCDADAIGVFRGGASKSCLERSARAAKSVSRGLGVRREGRRLRFGLTTRRRSACAFLLLLLLISPENASPESQLPATLSHVNNICRRREDYFTDCSRRKIARALTSSY